MQQRYNEMAEEDRLRYRNESREYLSRSSKTNQMDAAEAVTLLGMELPLGPSEDEDFSVNKLE